MPFNIGPGELIIVLVIALVVLGPGKLPDVAASLGKSLREFRKAATDVSEATRIDAPPPSPAVPSTAVASSPPVTAVTPPAPTPAAVAEPDATGAEPARDPNVP